MPGILDLWGLRQSASILKWLANWEPTHVKVVQQEMDDLVNNLTMSLKNLHTAVCEITDLPPEKLDRKSFEAKYDYFINFYLGHENISMARTHCGNVERDVKRMRFKLERAGFTDVGEWQSVDQFIDEIKSGDDMLLQSYDNSVSEIQRRLDGIKTELESGNVSEARSKYLQLKKDLTADILELNKGKNAMERAKNHLRKVLG